MVPGKERLFHVGLTSRYIWLMAHLSEFSWARATRAVTAHSIYHKTWVPPSHPADYFSTLEICAVSKQKYEASARSFIGGNKNTDEIFEGKWNSSRGGQSGETQTIIRADGKQAIINKSTGQSIDFYEGTSLDGFINVMQVQ